MWMLCSFVWKSIYMIKIKKKKHQSIKGKRFSCSWPGVHQGPSFVTFGRAAWTGLTPGSSLPHLLTLASFRQELPYSSGQAGEVPPHSPVGFCSDFHVGYMKKYTVFFCLFIFSEESEKMILHWMFPGMQMEWVVSVWIDINNKDLKMFHILSLPFVRWRQEKIPL